MVALVGMPGSGKTTAARALERLIWPSCLVLPMDGYHVPMSVLRERPDAADAIYRRGAPDTFDAEALKASLRQIRCASVPTKVMLPDFDHAVGDPAPNVITFDRQRHRIVLVEGLYLLHAGEGWAGTSDLFDYKIYIDTAEDVCIDRVKERNKVIPGYTPEEIDVRCEKVDRANAHVVQKTAGKANVRVTGGTLGRT